MNARRTQSLLIVGSTAVTLLLAEATLRVFNIRLNSSFYTLDLIRGWALRPGAQGWHTEENPQYIHINDLGMRDAPRKVDREPNTFRIAVLGDSFTEAMQVPRESTFPAVLERTLAESGSFRGRKIEVLNFGVSGYGTAQELLTLRYSVSRFHPDLVLLAFCTGNDIYNNHPYLNPTNADAAPYFRFDAGRLIEQLPFSRSETGQRVAVMREYSSRVINQVRLLQLLSDSFYASLHRLDQPAPQKVADLGADYLDRLIYLPPFHPAMAEAWRVTEALVRLMKQEAESLGARLWLVTLSNPIQVYPDRLRREDFRRRIGAADLFYPDLQLQAVAAREGIPAVILAPKLLEYAEAHHVFLHGFTGEALGRGHWNQSGHRVASQILAEELSQAFASVATSASRSDSKAAPSRHNW
jgi:lysophospholipase L1-like esterase